MNGVAAEIAVEIGVFFQNNDVHSSACEEIAGHHARRSAADDETADVDVGKHAHESGQRTKQSEADQNCLQQKDDGIPLMVSFISRNRGGQ